MVEDSTGSMLFPKYAAEPSKGFYVLKPSVSSKNGLHISGAVSFRHGRKGGTKIHIGGQGFDRTSKVIVGTKMCKIVKQTSRLIVCDMLAHSGGPLSVDVTVETASKSAILKKAVLYMQV